MMYFGVKELEFMTPGHSCPALCRPLGTFGPHRAACKVPLAWVTAAFRLRSGGSTESPGERKVWKGHSGAYCDAASSLSRDQDAKSRD